MTRPLDRIEIEGYKSVAACDLTLRPLNVLVGPNGAGKSNFISVFGLLGAMVNGSLQLAVGRAGGASTILHGGPKQTPRLRLHTYFGVNQYDAALVPTANDELIFEHETCYFMRSDETPWSTRIASGTRESSLRDAATMSAVPWYCLHAMESWRVFHFHDTSAQAGSKQKQPLADNNALRSDGSNVAPLLYRLREAHPDHYRRIVDSIRMVAPFFHDFTLRPDRLNADRIQLEWRQVGSDQYFNAHALSDGTLRFICLSTLLLQPEPPPVVVIDEPELGLHPYAITQLADMVRAASVQHQLIVSTQSVTLLNQFDPADVIVTEQHHGASTFQRPDWEALQVWLRECAVGELWEKNVLGGRPY